jgi:hypothetical protein
MIKRDGFPVSEAESLPKGSSFGSAFSRFRGKAVITGTNAANPPRPADNPNVASETFA